jgi:GTP-binding protein HflX
LYNLPHHLIEAFKATLEEVSDANLLIHVLDVAHPRVYEHNKSVFEVLKELQADNKPVITALNKIDLLDDNIRLERLMGDFINPIPISAKFGKNLNFLSEEIQKNFAGKMVTQELLVPHQRMDLIDLFYRNGKIEEIKYLQKGIKVRLTLPKILSQRILNDKEIEKR